MGAPMRQQAAAAVASPEPRLLELSGLSKEDARQPARRRPQVIAELYRAFKEEGRKLVDILWEQHRFHESRRWNAVELVESVRPERLTELDRLLVWCAGQAEMTAKPSADRMTRLADAECRRWQGKDDALASVIQALGSWTRYWNEEEAHHEMGFMQLSLGLGFPAPTDASIIDYRKIFPDDDLLRTVTMLSFSEGIAAVDYGQYARRVQDPALKSLLKHVGADEVQHMQYFISFAKALVDSGAYSAKEAFAVGHLFLRDGGEMYGSMREHVEHRETHVNWWDHLEQGVGRAAAAPESIERKRCLILHSLRRITGIACSSAEEVEDVWMDLVGD